MQIISNAEKPHSLWVRLLELRDQVLWVNKEKWEEEMASKEVTEVEEASEEETEADSEVDLVDLEEDPVEDLEVDLADSEEDPVVDSEVALEDSEVEEEDIENYSCYY